MLKRLEAIGESHAMNRAHLVHGGGDPIAELERAERIAAEVRSVREVKKAEEIEPHDANREVLRLIGQWPCTLGTKVPANGKGG